MIEIVENDLFEVFEGSGVQAIAHQANIENRMGRGIALEIACRYPESYQMIKGEPNQLLGSVLACQVKHGSIYHVFAQSLNGNGRKTNYEAFTNGFEAVKEHMKSTGLQTLGVPYGIGCGLGGGNFKVIYAILDSIFGDERTMKLTICKKV